MTENDSDNRCRYCDGRDMRDTLAGALESGGYREQPAEDRRPDAQLRDSQDRYTVTGVAVDAMFPFLWIRNQGNWYAFDHERIPEERQKRKLPHEMTSLSQDEFWGNFPNRPKQQEHPNRSAHPGIRQGCPSPLSGPPPFRSGCRFACSGLPS